MASASRRRAPSGLGERGAGFWRASVAQYEFSGAEVALLEEVCRCLDRLNSLTDAIAELGPMVTGSQGQPVVNPALTEARGQQAILHRLVAALQLPDADGASIPTGRRLGASTAAQSRWGTKSRDAS